jgi:hypothetical protein
VALLDDADLAFMRATQAEARPTEASLLRRLSTRTPTGGQATGWADPEPVAIRVDGPPDEVPLTLAGRLEGGTAVMLAMDMVEDVRYQDRVVVSPTEVYEVISDGDADGWATAQNVMARRIVRPER